MVNVAMLIVLYVGSSDALTFLREVGFISFAYAFFPSVVLGTSQYYMLKKGERVLNRARLVFIFFCSLTLCFTLGFGLTGFMLSPSHPDSGVLFLMGILYGNEILIYAPLRSLLSIAIAFLAYRYIIVDRVLACEWESEDEEPENDFE